MMEIDHENFWIIIVVLTAISSLIIFFIAQSLCSRFKKKPKEIRGKIALVTGGGNGLGRELCIELSKHGCKIAIADIDYEGALKTLGMLQNVQAKAYKIDLLKNEDIASLKDRIINDFGTLDILLNNAGIISYSTMFHESEELIKNMSLVNLVAPILLIRTFMPLMISKNSGHIVTISSMSGVYHFPDALVYSATKFGLTGFMMGLKELLRRRKLDKCIQTTTIFPAVMPTNNVVMNAVKPGFEVVETKKVALRVVKAILMNESETSVPKNMHKRARLFQVAPKWLQNLTRDLRKESERFNVTGIEEI